MEDRCAGLNDVCAGLDGEVVDCLAGIIRGWIAEEEAGLRRMDGLAMMTAYRCGRIAALSRVLIDGLYIAAIQAMEKERE